MKKIEAIIKPFKVEEIREALARLGVEGMTLSEVRGIHWSKRRGQVCFQNNGSSDFLPQVKLEIVVLDTHASAAIAVVTKGARNGRNQDMRVLVYEIECAVRIRTEERNEAAI